MANTPNAFSIQITSRTITTMFKICFTRGSIGMNELIAHNNSPTTTIAIIKPSILIHTIPQ